MSFFTKKVGGASPLPAALTIVNVALLQQVKVTNYLRKFNCVWRKIGWFLRLMGFFAPHPSTSSGTVLLPFSHSVIPSAGSGNKTPESYRPISIFFMRLPSETIISFFSMLSRTVFNRHFLPPGSASLHPGLFTFNPFGARSQQVQPCCQFSHFPIFIFIPPLLPLVHSSLRPLVLTPPASCVPDGCRRRGGETLSWQERGFRCPFFLPRRILGPIFCE